MTALGSSFLEDDKIVKFAKKKKVLRLYLGSMGMRLGLGALHWRVGGVTDPSVDENEFFQYREKQNEQVMCPSVTKS